MNITPISPTLGAVIPGSKPLDLTGDHIAIALSRHGRERLETFVAVAIDLLDLNDGDFDLEEDDADSGIEDDPRGCDPETDYCVDDYGEEDRASDAPVPAYPLNQCEGLARPDAVADMPCCNITLERQSRPVLKLRHGGRA